MRSRYLVYCIPAPWDMVLGNVSTFPWAGGMNKIDVSRSQIRTPIQWNRPAQGNIGSGSKSTALSNANNKQFDFRHFRYHHPVYLCTEHYPSTWAWMAWNWIELNWKLLTRQTDSRPSWCGGRFRWRACWCSSHHHNIMWRSAPWGVTNIATNKHISYCLAALALA